MDEKPIDLKCEHPYPEVDRAFVNGDDGITFCDHMEPVATLCTEQLQRLRAVLFPELSTERDASCRWSSLWKQKAKGWRRMCMSWIRLQATTQNERDAEQHRAFLAETELGNQIRLTDALNMQFKAFQDGVKWCSVCSGGWTDGPTCPYCDRRLFQKQVEQDEKDRQVWLKESEGCVRSVNKLARQRDELMEQIAILNNALESSGEQCAKWERRARDEHETNVRLEAKLKQAEEDLDYYKGFFAP